MAPSADFEQVDFGPPAGGVLFVIEPILRAPRLGRDPKSADSVDPRQCESVGINSDRRGAWGMIAYGGGNE